MRWKTHATYFVNLLSNALFALTNQFLTINTKGKILSLIKEAKSRSNRFVEKQLQWSQCSYGSVSARVVRWIERRKGMLFTSQKFNRAARKA